MNWNGFVKKWLRAFLTAGCVTALLLLYGCATSEQEEKVRDLESEKEGSGIYGSGGPGDSAGSGADHR